MPKGESQLPPALEAQLRKLFGKMDRDHDQILSKASCLPPQACVAVASSLLEPSPAPPLPAASNSSPCASHLLTCLTPPPLPSHPRLYPHRHPDPSPTKAEAVEYWGKNFAKINAQAMFNEVTPAIVSRAIVSRAIVSIATGHVQRSERRPRRYPSLQPRVTQAATLRNPNPNPGGRRRRRHHLHRRMARVLAQRARAGDPTLNTNPSPSTCSRRSAARPRV